MNRSKKIQFKDEGNGSDSQTKEVRKDGKIEEEEEFEREEVVEDPKFTGIRKAMRDWLLPYVKQGVHLVVDIQKKRSKRKTQFNEFVSLTGTHNFMIGFFPILFFIFGRFDLGRQLACLIGFGTYLGNWFKDYLCLPRPAYPALRLSKCGSKEFGFPSTHSTTAFALPFYILLFLVPMGSIQFYIGFVVAVVYTYVISYSRIYLGMHSMADILGGIAIGFFLLVVWYFIGLGDMIDYWVLNGSYVVPISIVFGALLLILHPEPVVYCPCFEDSACFIGSCIGILCGSARNRYSSFTNFSYSAMFIRYAIGIVAMLATRFILKPLMWRVLPWFYDVFGFRGRRFLPHLSSGHKMNIKSTMKSVPSLGELDTAGDTKKPPHDVDIPTKYIVYGAMCWVGAELCPEVFALLNLL